MNKELKLLIYIYGVRIYTAIITIVLIPIIIGEIGIEAYGLVGFFTVLQACLSILDAGVGGVLTREAILSRGNLDSFRKFNRVYLKIIFLFSIIALTMVFAGWILSIHYSSSWLNTNLDNKIVISSITLMFWIFALRYIQGPFRSILLSNESQITLSTINFINITLSQPITICILKFFNGGVELYFILQLISAGVCCGLMIICSERVRKKILRTCHCNFENTPGEYKSSVGKIVSFALQLSTLSILWVFVNQSDKLALTKFMPLAQYGMYSVAVSVISVLAILSDPLNQYLQPRLTKYYHQNDFELYSKVFFTAFKFIAVITIPLSTFLIFFSEQTIFMWSLNQVLSKEVAKYLPWLFVGGVFAIYSNFIFLLLYSFGQLKKHTLVYAVFSIIVIPLNVYLARKYLGEGTSIFFACSSLFLFVIWGGYNLNYFFINGLKILYVYMLPLFIIEVGYFGFVQKFYLFAKERWNLFLELSLIGLCGITIALLYFYLLSKICSKISYKVIKNEHLHIH